MNLSQTHTILVYAAIIVVAIIEGPILSILFGVLIKLGNFPFLQVYLALMIGDIIGDIGWYHIGRYFGMRFVRRFGKYFSITEENVGKVTRIFHKYHDKILLVSKLTSGFGFAMVTLMVAGMVKIPFWKYLSINVLGQFVWTGLLIALGYFLGHLYTTVSSILGKASIVVLFIIFIFALNGYRKYVANKMSESDSTILS